MSSQFYETDRALSEYLLFHYGTAAEILPYGFGPSEALHFPVRCVTECLDPSRLVPGSCALDAGCAVGRSTFELARYCEKVVGLDASPRFIDAARELKKYGRLEFLCVQEGKLATAATAIVPPAVNREKVIFQTGDAQALGGFGSFDIVLMANVIDRLREPQRCLESMGRVVAPGGQLILTSPYTWSAEFTPEENWLGGFVRDGKSIRTIDTLQELLHSDFNLILQKDLPFLIREHARKFQWSVAQATVWLRK